jgi:hypothetical protein
VTTPDSPDQVFLQDVHDNTLRQAVRVIEEVKQLLEMSKSRGLDPDRVIDIGVALDHARKCRDSLRKGASPEAIG